MYRITRNPNYIIRIPSIDVMSIKTKLSTTVTARYYYLSSSTRHITNKQQQLPRIIVQVKIIFYTSKSYIYVCVCV